MRSHTAEDLGGRCSRCFLPHPCLCGELPALAPKLEVVIIRHMLERKKSTNSARWAALALPGTRVHEWGLRHDPLDVHALVTPGTWVLYPIAHTTLPPVEPPKRLIVVDGSWTQARRILHRSTALRGLPRLSLPPPPPRERLRQQKEDVGMSTLEAIAAAYRYAGEPNVADALEALYDTAVRKALAIRGRRTV